MELKLTTKTGKASTKSITVSDEAFGKEFNDKLKNDPVFANKFEKTSSQKNNIKKLKLGRIIGILR